MISKNTFSFLADLSKNNNKEWFEANKPRYQKAQHEIKNLLSVWINEFGKIDENIAHLEPSKCIFRIHRDVRFSKDKSPYKLNLGAFIVCGGKNSNLAGYYLHIEPNKCFFGAGNYAPTPEQINKIRQEIDYNFRDFQSIVSDKKFATTFGKLDDEQKLKRAPKGYEEDNEAIEYLKLKSFTVFAKVKDTEILKPDFMHRLVELSTMSKPLIDFLNTAVD
ncbi:MAG: DUF2461 domain-containing protein [Sphingobacteriales bacterium]|jgi:uncharacterized protein (TIGR02453 family)|nr:MAG: DUF2461 domain-containing protein [Sphingobacteriales bacterium]